MALVQEVKNGQLVDNTATGNSLSKKNEKEPGALGKEDFLKLMVFSTLILYPPRCKSFPHSIKTVPFGSVTT